MVPPLGSYLRHFRIVCRRFFSAASASACCRELGISSERGERVQANLLGDAGFAFPHGQLDGWDVAGLG